ncbi:MAG: hypothetical protein IPP72_11400 [Chitinophagaceae bacterium]|nr:hypothetical protein [Chitinophagaceae bacterium]
MMYKNFIVFNEPAKAKATIVISVLVFIFIVCAGFILYVSVLPDVAYTLFATIIVAVAAQYYQEESTNSNVKRGAEIYSIGNAVLVCIDSIVILALLMF